VLFFFSSEQQVE